ncbi:hypothetical protein GW915_01340 [bacterium]|nr:hypothetical protein [bacterium]
MNTLLALFLFVLASPILSSLATPFWSRKPVPVVSLDSLGCQTELQGINSEDSTSVSDAMARIKSSLQEFRVFDIALEVSLYQSLLSPNEKLNFNETRTTVSELIENSSVFEQEELLDISSRASYFIFNLIPASWSRSSWNDSWAPFLEDALKMGMISSDGPQEQAKLRALLVQFRDISNAGLMPKLQEELSEVFMGFLMKLEKKSRSTSPSLTENQVSHLLSSVQRANTWPRIFGGETIRFENENFSLFLSKLERSGVLNQLLLTKMARALTASQAKMIVESRFFKQLDSTVQQELRELAASVPELSEEELNIAAEYNSLVELKKERAEEMARLEEFHKRAMQIPSDELAAQIREKVLDSIYRKNFSLKLVKKVISSEIPKLKTSMEVRLFFVETAEGLEAWKDAEKLDFLKAFSELYLSKLKQGMVFSEYDRVQIERVYKRMPLSSNEASASLNHFLSQDPFKTGEISEASRNGLLLTHEEYQAKWMQLKRSLLDVEASIESFR